MSNTPSLTPIQLRVLGSLIEKAETTPDQYPLTSNALRLACNQKTSREPVVDYDDATVRDALRELEMAFIVRQRSPADSRVAKWEHNANKVYDVTSKELAILGVLMLRGPQTVNEIRIRTERLYNFADIADVERTLDRLATRTPQAYVIKLPKLSGHKEPRYAHLLSGPVDVDALTASLAAHASTPPAPVAGDHRLEQLETELSALREQVQHLHERLTKLESARL
jgi:uncharacterized protein